MASKYFNKYFKTGNPEHKLLDQITKESVKITGFEVYYLPKNYIMEEILFEAKSSNYTNYYPLDVNIKDTSIWEGGLDAMSKFGIVNDNRATLRCSIKAFTDLKIPGRLTEPQTGDLIFFAPGNTFFEITWFNSIQPFYQLGKISVFEMSVESFKFNAETFNTGVTAIDTINVQLSNAANIENAQNDEIKSAATTVRDATITDLFGGL